MEASIAAIFSTPCDGMRSPPEMEALAPRNEGRPGIIPGQFPEKQRRGLDRRDEQNKKNKNDSHAYHRQPQSVRKHLFPSLPPSPDFHVMGRPSRGEKAA